MCIVVSFLLSFLFLLKSQGFGAGREVEREKSRREEKGNCGERDEKKKKKG